MQPDRANDGIGTAELPDARLVDIPGAKHEILHETDAVRAAFWREVDAFLG